MAGAMAVIAMGQDNQPRSERAVSLFDPAAVPNESVEIIALSEEKSREAADIIEDRQMAANPLKGYAKSISNQLAGRETAGEESEVRRRKKAKSSSNLVTKFFFEKMPIFTWLPSLTLKGIQGDIIAGITVGVMVIPQSMSYAAIAGLPYINGMYSACVPTLIYAFFGQSKQLAVGPVAMVSLLVEAGLQGKLTREECPEWYEVGGESAAKAQYEVCPEQYVALACLTALVVGVMQVVGAFLKLGFLVTFLGHPVISGFTSAAAIIIGLSQAKYLLGYDIPKSQFIYETIWNIVTDLHKIQGMSFFLGLVFLAFLMGNKRLAAKVSRLRVMGPMGPLISVAVGTLLLFAIPVLRERFHVQYVGHVPSGLMPVSVGSWDLSKLGAVLPTAMSATLIGYMESIAIGKNLASKHGYEIEAGQEMLALGISNVVGAAFSCYPVTGSFSRSAVNNTTGASSQLSGIVTAVVMFCTLLWLTRLFHYLPKFVLAVIVMNSVIPLVDIQEARHLLRVKRHDFILWVVAFIGTLFLGVLMGIIMAVALSLIIVIYESVRPQITILWRIPGTTIYRNMKQESSGSFISGVFICRIGSSMYFANASFVKEMLLAYAADLENVNKTEYLVLEMTPVITIDSTACHVIHDIVSDFRARGINVAFAMVGNRVDRTMRKAKLKQFIGEKWFFATVNDAVHFCLKHQHAKHMKAMHNGGAGIDASASLDLSTVDMGWGDEIGISNDMHSEHTMVFINLRHERPTVVSEITQLFKRSKICIVRYQIEPLQEGAKHTYFLKSATSNSKLSERERERVKEDLEAFMKSQAFGNSMASPATIGKPAAAEADPEDRLAALENKVRELQGMQRLSGGDSPGFSDERAHKMSF